MDQAGTRQHDREVLLEDDVLLVEDVVKCIRVVNYQYK